MPNRGRVFRKNIGRAGVGAAIVGSFGFAAAGYQHPYYPAGVGLERLGIDLGMPEIQDIGRGLQAPARGVFWGSVVGSAAAAGLGLGFGVFTPVTAAAGAAVGVGLGFARGWTSYVEARHQLMTWVGRQAMIPPSGRFYDVPTAISHRQRAMQEIMGSRMNARSMLGNEASLLHS